MPIKLVIFWTLLASPLTASELRLLAWNVESGTPNASDPAQGNDPETIADELRELKGYDIIGLSEVRPQNIKLYVNTLSEAGDTFLSIHSATGRDDTLVLAYNNTTVQLLSGYELHRFGDWLTNDYRENGAFRYRSPLIGHFKDRQTGTEFLVTVNHLARGDENIRARQATGLRKWAESHPMPIIGIGDFNFDFDFERRKGNRAYDQFIKGGVWRWLEPRPLIDTNWSDENPRLPINQRTDRYQDSCLDFIFVAGQAKDWQAESKVVVRDGDFPDDATSSDQCTGWPACCPLPVSL